MLKRRQKIEILLIAVSAITLILAMLLAPKYKAGMFALYMISYLSVGGRVLKSAAADLIRLQPLNENFLMTAATVGAAFLGEYNEAVAVMLFYAVGTLFEEIAVEKSRNSVSALMDIRPDYAVRYAKDSEGNILEERVDPQTVALGETVIIRPGELIPLDGTIIEGSTSLDMSPLTGESLPVDLGAGDVVISGSVNISGVIVVQTTSIFEESTVSKILDLVENASARKGKIERFITRFARIYTPIVVAAAAIIALLPPLILANAHFGDWVYRALIFLVVSCPCALVISVPLSFFAGIGKASALGILIKGGNYMEVLAQADTVVFDKTGTLTLGRFTVTDIVLANDGRANSIAPDTSALIRILAAVEQYSNHPLAVAIREKYAAMAAQDGENEPLSARNDTNDMNMINSDINALNISNVEEIAGFGLRAKMEIVSRSGSTEMFRVIAGNSRLMQEHSVEISNANLSIFESHTETFVHLAVAPEKAMAEDFASKDFEIGDLTSEDIAIGDAANAEGEQDGGYFYLGSAALADDIKPDAKAAIAALYDGGVRRTVMLTGDRQAIACKIADSLDIGSCAAELLPADKVAHIENLIVARTKEAEKDSKGSLAFVGDGINDAPALAIADIGIAMGGAGSDAAIEAADIVIMNDELMKIPVAKRLALKTVRTARQNVVFALSVKFIVLILAAAGHASMWLAIFADVGVAVLAILNSMRLLLLKIKAR